VEAEFSGTLSRGSAYDSEELEIRAAVTLTIAHSLELEVDKAGWICVEAEDILGPLSNLDVWVAVKDSSDTPIFQTSGTTQDGKFNTSWTPTKRGWINISAWSEEQSWYDTSSSHLLSGIYEQPIVQIVLPDILAPDSATITLTVLDSTQSIIPDVNASITVSLNTEVIFDDEDTTDDLGIIIISVDINEPGQLAVLVQIDAQRWLLSSNQQEECTILGKTNIELNLAGFPINQGTSLGIMATITGWNGSPLLYSNITLGVLWPNGTIINIDELNSTSSGTCLLYHEFKYIGDFNVTAVYQGKGLQSPVTVSGIQRVHVTPNLHLIHDTNGLAGEAFDFSIWLTDALGRMIQDRTLNLSILIDDTVVHTTEILSSVSPIITSWIPQKRGIAIVTLTHFGDDFYLNNSSDSSFSIMDQVEGVIDLNPSSISLFEEITITYTLHMDSDPANIPIIFEVLGTDLIKVWGTTEITNESGIAEQTYYANHSYGQLTVKAKPSEVEFLSGGDTESDLIIMTDCIITCDLIPSPPIMENELNITIQGEDELGGLIDGLSVKVELWNPNGDQIKLGLFSKSISKQLEDGLVHVLFVPELAGFYTINITSSGSNLVHSFKEQFQRIVYKSTILSVSVNAIKIRVNDPISLSILLTDTIGTGLMDKMVILSLDGPASHDIGPFELTTDIEGKASWDFVIDEVGLWIALVKFSVSGVYLADEDQVSIDAMYGTRIGVAVLDTGDIIASITPLSLTVYLEDSASNPLEGRIIGYEVYHDNYGFITRDSVMMSGHLPEPLNITLTHMGNHTIIFSYNGTIHYNPSNTAIRLWVRGTCEISINGPTSINRSTNTSIEITFLDEIQQLISPNSLETSIRLSSSEGLINLTNILSQEDDSIVLSLFGLEVGGYLLNVSVFDSKERLGCDATCIFNVTTQTFFIIGSQTPSGIVGDEYEINVVLTDSLNQIILDSIIYVSLYDPNGREIYGSILKERTPVEAPEGSVEIIWTPQKSGIYRIFVEFEGIPYIEGCNRTLELLVRHSCTYNVLTSEPVTYPESPSLSYSLISNIGGVPGASINITIIHANGTRHWLNHFTDSRGNGQVLLDNMHAGFHEIILNYSGSEEYTSCWTSTNVTVKPNVDVEIQSIVNAFTENNCSLNLAVNVNGVENDWNGSIRILHLKPNGGVAGSWELKIYKESDISINFIPEIEGEHSLDVFVWGLPIISNYSAREKFSVSIPVPVIEIPMDVSTTPVQIAGIILPFIAFAINKRIGSWLGSISGEWEE
jgi:hypothetical protein